MPQIFICFIYLLIVIIIIIILRMCLQPETYFCGNIFFFMIMFGQVQVYKRNSATLWSQYEMVIICGFTPVQAV